MGKKKAPSGVSGSKPESPRTRLFKSLQEWNKSRLKSAPLAKEVVDLRNETTYMTADRVSDAVGLFVRPSNLYIDVTEKLHGTLSQLETQLKVMTNCVDVMTSLLLAEREWEQRESEKDATDAAEGSERALDDEYEPLSATIDVGFLEELVGEALQQTLLEKNMQQQLKSTTEGASLNLGMDHDSSVTLLACYSYAPCLNENSLKLALETLA